MRNSTLSKEFVQAGGLKLLLDTADLPCIPMHLGHGPGGLYGTVLGMLQTIGEHDYTEVATALLDSVIVAMNKVQDIWKEGHPWDDLGDRLPVLRGLIVRLSNLSNYFISLPPTQHRSVLPMLKAVGAASNGSFLKDAGEFHRTTMSAVSTFKVREGTEEDTPMDDAKGSAAKYLSSRLYTGFTKVFRCECPSRMTRARESALDTNSIHPFAISQAYTRAQSTQRSPGYLSTNHRHLDRPLRVRQEARRPERGCLRYSGPGNRFASALR